MSQSACEFTAYIGGTMHWPGSTARDTSAAGLNWLQIEEMVSSGLCTLGNHTHRHVPPGRLNEYELESVPWFYEFGPRDVLQPGQAVVVFVDDKPNQVPLNANNSNLMVPPQVRGSPGLPAIRPVLLGPKLSWSKYSTSNALRTHA